MTLVFTAGRADHVVQASDRRLTRPDGTLFTDDSNKAILVHCTNARFALAYTGLAFFDGQPTDRYLLNYLVSVRVSQLTLGQITQELLEHLSKVVIRQKLPATTRRLTIVMAGFGRPGPFVGQISNFERWQPSEHSTEAASRFHSEYWSRTKKAKGRPLFLVANGYEQAITDRIHFKIQRLRKKSFFHRADPRELAQKLVDLIREAAQAPESSGCVGESCMTVRVPYDHTESAQAQYHPASADSVSYMPHVIGRGWAAMDITIE